MTATPAWTPADIPGQQGRLALVTGANSGVGYQTSLELARAGAAVVLAGRSDEALRDAADRIRQEVPDAELTPVRLDLADLSSVAEAAEKVLALDRALDVLVNNAGVMAVPDRRTTTDGFELTFGTNHLGHYALTGWLLPILLWSPGARVVTVSARVARNRGVTFDDPMSEAKYTPMGAYSRSKLANVVFARELARRAEGTTLTSVAVHPGSAMTGIQRYVPRAVNAALGVLQPLLMQSPAQAAHSSLRAATDSSVPAGAFLTPRGFLEGSGTPTISELPPAAADPEVGRALWELSERLTHVTYDFG